MEQIPPLSHINSFGRPGQEGPGQLHDSRKAPEAAFQRRGYAAGPRNVQDHYNYNSDPNSESSSFGGSNNTSAHDYDVNFGDVPLHLELSNQLDGQTHTNGSGQDRKMFPGNGNSYADGYSNPAEAQSQNSYRQSATSPSQSQNPYRHTISPSQNPYHNPDHAGNDKFSGNSPIIDGGGVQTSPGRYSSPQSPSGLNRRAVPIQPTKIPPPTPVTIVPEPEVKKKKGLLKRLSKT